MSYTLLIKAKFVSVGVVVQQYTDGTQAYLSMAHLKRLNWLNEENAAHFGGAWYQDVIQTSPSELLENPVHLVWWLGISKLNLRNR